MKTLLTIVFSVFLGACATRTNQALYPGYMTCDAENLGQFIIQIAAQANRPGYYELKVSATRLLNRSGEYLQASLTDGELLTQDLVRRKLVHEGEAVFEGSVSGGSLSKLPYILILPYQPGQVNPLQLDSTGSEALCEIPRNKS